MDGPDNNGLKVSTCKTVSSRGGEVEVEIKDKNNRIISQVDKLRYLGVTLEDKRKSDCVNTMMAHFGER